jgi:hypothetical protein
MAGKSKEYGLHIAKAPILIPLIALRKGTLVSWLLVTISLRLNSLSILFPISIRAIISIKVLLYDESCSFFIKAGKPGFKTYHFLKIKRSIQ